jgi:peptidylprolyl isomerase
VVPLVKVTLKADNRSRLLAGVFPFCQGRFEMENERGQFNDDCKERIHHYDETVFKTSCGSKPLKFKIGQSMLMRAFEQTVVGMKPGESRTVKVTADKAYGPRREEMVVAVDRKEFPDNVKPYVGLELDICQQDGKVFPAKVIEVSESSVTLDANHPLAGKDLIFDIELVEII